MKRTLAVVVGIAGVALAAVTFAQPFGMGPGAGPRFGAGGPGFGGPGFGPGMGMRAGHGPMVGVDSAAAIDARMSDLKTQLKITPEQEAAWQTFSSAAKQQAAGMQALREQMHSTTGTASERMTEHTQAMQQRSAAMTATTNAFNALYAVLTPEQKTIADQRHGPMAHRGMPFGGRAG
jgi:periplasmic protein CpxP/Spy